MSPILALAAGGTELPPWALVAAAVALVLFGLWLGWGRHGRVERRRAARARKLGRRGERRGLALLRRAGYRVEDTQPTAHLTLLVDGAPTRYPVRADALVTRGGRRFVAEIKAGASNASLSHRGTRRQVIEYVHAFDVDGVLLVDVPGGRVVRVELERG